MPDGIQLKSENFVKRLANAILHCQFLSIKLYMYNVQQLGRKH